MHVTGVHAVQCAKHETGFSQLNTKRYSMKQKHLLTLLREDFTTIGVVFAGMSIDAPGAPASPPNMPQPVPAPWARDEDKAHAQRMELNRTYGKFGSPRTPVASMYTGASYTYKIK